MEVVVVVVVVLVVAPAVVVVIVVIIILIIVIIIVIIVIIVIIIIIIITGTFVPVTDTGTLVADGIFASCYAFTQHDFAHLTTWLYRSFPWIMGPWQQNGFSPILSNLVDLGEIIIPESLLV